MISLRLPIYLESQLNKISKIEHVSKTQLIINAISQYFKDFKMNKNTPYELGKDYFGKYSLNDKNASQNYKIKIKNKIHEKYNN